MFIYVLFCFIMFNLLYLNIVSPGAAMPVSASVLTKLMRLIKTTKPNIDETSVKHRYLFTK